IAFPLNRISVNAPVTPNGDFTAFTTTTAGLYEITYNIQGIRTAATINTAAFSIYTGPALIPFTTSTLPPTTNTFSPMAAGNTFILRLLAGIAISIRYGGDSLPIDIVSSYLAIQKISD
ncbi:MAG: hypothetical protein LBT22_07425, partial [Peptococcaceae bacterium]|nr:hypothetical protein [Peptococcaceae bacterium]